MGRREVVTKEFIDEADRDDEQAAERDVVEFNAGISLFDANPTAADEKKITRIHIFRKGPLEEGFLGELEPSGTVDQIKEAYGGGKFRLEAKNDQGRIVRVRELTIAGDPVWASEIARKRWAKMNGDAGTPATESMSMRDMLILMEEREGKREEARRRDDEKREESRRREDEARRREDRERDERAAKEHAEREERQRKDAAEREERRRKDEDEREERRRTQQREDEERRQRAHKEDLERQAMMNTSQQQQQQAVFQSMLAMVKGDAEKASTRDPVEMLVQGITLAKQLGGNGGDGDGEPKDALTAIISRAPELLAELRSTAAAARGGGGGGHSKGGAGLTIKGTLAKKIRHAASLLTKQGQDPTKVFGQAADYIIANASKAGKDAPDDGQAANPATKRKPGRPRKVKARIVTPAPEAGK